MAVSANAVLVDDLAAEPEPEEEDALGQVTEQQLGRITLSASDWTAETILSQLERGNIDLAPRFQRRDAWTRDRKSKFLESLIVNFPVPQVVLAEKKGARGQFIVLDGKQRLTALYKFAGKADPLDPLNGFSLVGLDVLKGLSGASYDDLETNPSFAAPLNALLNQTIRTVVIRNWNDESLLHLIFIRLNTSSVPLSPQELRLALYPGEFVNYVDDRSFNSLPLRDFMGLDHPDFRMRDVEVMLRFLAFHFFLDDYSGNMSKFLNETTQRLNESFDARRGEIEAAVDSFESALVSGMEIFGERQFARKWNGSKYEGQWNRAVLDVMLYYFAIPHIRTTAQRRQQMIVASYQDLFNRDPRFRDAVGATTKSLTATRDRFVLWGEALETAVETPVPIPAWDEGRNRFVSR